MAFFKGTQSGGGDVLRQLNHIGFKFSHEQARPLPPPPPPRATGGGGNGDGTPHR